MLWIHTDKKSDVLLFPQLYVFFSGIAVHTILPASRLPVINESIYPKGVVLLQNLPSIICGWVVDAQANEHILDMCAAPGNKTTHLAEMSNDKVSIRLYI